MIILDKKLEELEKMGKPIRVGLVGAGTAARAFAHQLLSIKQGMRLVAISNRTIANAKRLYFEAGTRNLKRASTFVEFEESLDKGNPTITQNSEFLCDSKRIDVIVEATGTVEFGASIVLRAIKNKKHVVLINAELDATIGPILKIHADKQGVVYTQADGDQPAVLMNLYREVKGLGFKPVMVGNIKSLIDPYRTPATQEKWAKENHQKAYIATTFVDGTKISQEMATISNATGFPVGQRGMYGPRCNRVEEANKLFPMEKLLNGGLTDYILGAEPSFGVFVLGYSEDPVKQKYMQMYNMGPGPIYTFYRPYHLSALEAPLTVARAFLFKDRALAPLAGPVCHVLTIAKKDLKKGETLDGVGGFSCYGVIDNASKVYQENLLPIGLSDGCLLVGDIPKDTPITFKHVKLPYGRIADKLWQEQKQIFNL